MNYAFSYIYFILFIYKMDFINKIKLDTDKLPIPKIKEKKQIKSINKKKDKKQVNYLDELLNKEYIEKYFNEK